jgi:hypothetical protein
MPSPCWIGLEVVPVTSVTPMKRIEHWYQRSIYKVGSLTSWIRINFIPRIVSDIEGTLELSELYSYVGAINTEDEPKPVIDDNPSKEDVEFMMMAHNISMNSCPDKSTKVNTCTSSNSNIMVNHSGRGHNSRSTQKESPWWRLEQDATGMWRQVCMGQAGRPYSQDKVPIW